MEKNRDLFAHVMAMSDALPRVTDYYSGLVRRVEPLPDNVVLFQRKSLNRFNYARTKPSFHQRWVLIFALRGKATLQLDQHSVDIPSGGLTLIPPLRLHRYSRASASLRWLFVTFDWPRHTASDAYIGSVQYIGAQTLDLLRQLLAVTQREAANATIAAATLLELIRVNWPLDDAVEARDGQLLDMVRALCGERPDISLAEVARKLGMSESHLRARFRSAYGISLGSYLRETRLRRAALLLQIERASVGEAAAFAGYADIATFSRAFRKCLGYNPSSVAKGLNSVER